MDVTLSSLYQEYELYKRAKAVTKDKACAAFKQLAAFFGDVPVGGLTPGGINKWAVWLERDAFNARTKRRGLAEHTVKSTVGAAAQVFGWAVRQGEYGLAANPFLDPRVESIKVHRHRVRFYTVDEVRDILRTAQDLSWRDPTKTLAWCGAIRMGSQAGFRKGEIGNFRWCDIDLDKGMIYVRWRPDMPGEYWAWGAKGKDDRDVPMGQTLWETMARLKEVRPWTYPFLMHRRWWDLMHRPWPLPEKLRDRPCLNWSREYRRILWHTNRRRLADGKEPIKAGDFHMLRKSLGTWLAQRSVPQVHVQATLGHASDDTTRQYYIGIDHRACIAQVRAVVNGIDL